MEDPFVLRRLVARKAAVEDQGMITVETDTWVTGMETGTGEDMVVAKTTEIGMIVGMEIDVDVITMIVVEEGTMTMMIAEEEEITTTTAVAAAETAMTEDMETGVVIMTIVIEIAGMMTAVTRGLKRTPMGYFRRLMRPETFRIK
jgi:hypothetical protein